MNHEPQAQTVLNLIEAFRRSKAMFTAVRLGIFDRLAKAPATSATVAKELTLNEPALSRLLNGCVSLELLERDGELYKNTGAANRFLTQDSAESLTGYIVYSDYSLFQLWSHLDDAIREGTNRWTQTFGGRSALFDHYFRDETSTRSFLGGMHGLGQLTSPRIVTAFDLSRFRHLVDLGGATGHLVTAACQAYPNLRATVLDLAPVERFAKEHIEKAGLSDRVKFVVGDFFSDAPFPEADLFALGRILHDWDDANVNLLLKKIFRELPQNGALLVNETLVNDDRSGPTYTLMQDLNMLVGTDGRERTESEYRTLLESAGFTEVQFQRTGSMVDAILAIKK